MKTSEFVGRQLERLDGRYLVWLSSGVVSYAPLNLTQEVPLFNQLFPGRFVIEAQGFLAFPDNVDYRIHDTGAAFHTFHVSDELTPCELYSTVVYQDSRLITELRSYDRGAGSFLIRWEGDFETQYVVGPIAGTTPAALVVGKRLPISWEILDTITGGTGQVPPSSVE